MIFSLENGDKVDVRFRYVQDIQLNTDGSFDVVRCLPELNETPNMTLCTISFVDETKVGRERYIPISFGISYCNKSHGDVFVKSVGRKIAFERALAMISPKTEARICFDSHSIKNRLSNYTPKTLRMLLWREYFKNFPV